MDQIQDDLKKEEKLGAPLSFDHDEDLPGLGQFYCTPCARHFADQSTMDAHCKSKIHKRRYPSPPQPPSDPLRPVPIAPDLTPHQVEGCRSATV